MGKRETLLEGLCGHALAFGADRLDIENRDNRHWVFVKKEGPGIRIANYARSSADAKELRENLHQAQKKPLHTAIGGRVWILKVRVQNNSGEGAFEVTIDPAPALDQSVAPPLTNKQGQYLAFIYNYTRIHRRPPAELDFQRYFQVSPPTVHQMIKTLELKRLIERTPGAPRSIRLLLAPQHLPRLA